MTVLVLAEHDNSALKDATLNAVSAATAIGGGVHILVAGHNCNDVAVAAQTIDGVSKVLVCDNENYAHPLAEELAPLLLSVNADYSAFVAPATTTGKNVFPRLAALLDVAQVSDIISVESDDTFKRPIYAGNAIQTVQSSDAKKVITVRTTGFEPAGSGGSAELVTISEQASNAKSSFVSAELSKSDRPELTSAKIIISGGRGMGSGENFALIEAVADKLGAGIGASRAAVDAGFVPNDYQVGQTGKIVAPELYVAVGISGAIQHLAGMKDSKIIVAINKDEDAPIFQIADYGLVADLFDILPELDKALS